MKFREVTMKILRFVRWWALAGLLVPLLVYLEGAITGDASKFPGLVVFLWPASIATMGLKDWGWFSIVILTILIAINVALYSLVGLLLWLIGRLVGVLANKLS